MSSDSSDRQWREEGGKVSARYRLHDVNLVWAETLFNRSPVGDKHSLSAYVAKSAGEYMVLVDGQGIGFAPVNWTRLDARLNQSPIPAMVDVVIVQVGGGEEYIVTVHITQV